MSDHIPPGCAVKVLEDINYRIGEGEMPEWAKGSYVPYALLAKQGARCTAMQSLLFSLVFSQSKAGEGWWIIPYKDVASIIGCSFSTARRTLQQLRKKSLIRISPTKVLHDNGSCTDGPNAYTVNIDRFEAFMETRFGGGMDEPVYFCSAGGELIWDE